jgi:CheY-like chemotaxis protein
VREVSGRLGGRDTDARLHVLVVDDNPDVARALQHLLAMLGHDVTVAHDGPGALAAAARVEPDLVFLDIGLPGMDGYAVGAALREAGHDRAALVALTGHAEDEYLHRSSRAGFDRHLVKPVDFATIHALTKEVAGRFAAP